MEDDWVVELPEVCKMSSMTNRSLSKKYAHCPEAKCSPVLDLCK